MIIYNILNKNSIITSKTNGGSTSFSLYLANELSLLNHNILYYDTSKSIESNFVQKHYINTYNNVLFFISSKEIFFNYIITMGSNIKNFDYIIIDTADSFGKTDIVNMFNILQLYGVKLIVSSQLRIDPNTAKPYSTVEKWNKEQTHDMFDLSIWIRDVNEPNNIHNRRYIDIFNKYRTGNKYTYRYILNFNKKHGNII
jgi:cellulose biosynthesis protein BcsQ